MPWIDNASGSSPHAAVWYEGPAEEWIRRFKYPPTAFRSLDPGVPAVIETLLERACAAIDPTHWQAVVPIPSTNRRIRRRGFFPAANLARSVARHLGCPYRPDLLRALGERPSQTGLNRSERLRNLRGAFCSRGTPPAEVLLVDDVSTTGATLAEATRVLRDAGARQIAGCCLARSRRSRASPTIFLVRPPR